MSKALDFYLDLCKAGTIEKNNNQIELISELDSFLTNNEKSLFSLIQFISKKYSKLFLYIWQCRLRKNIAYGFNFKSKSAG